MREAARGKHSDARAPFQVVRESRRTSSADMTGMPLESVYLGNLDADDDEVGASGARGDRAASAAPRSDRTRTATVDYYGTQQSVPKGSGAPSDADDGSETHEQRRKHRLTINPLHGGDALLPNGPRKCGLLWVLLGGEHHKQWVLRWVELTASLAEGTASRGGARLTFYEVGSRGRVAEGSPPLLLFTANE